MTKLTIVEPVVGELNSSADPKIPTGFKEVEKVINGELEGTNNFKAEGIIDANIKKGKALIATEEIYGAKTERELSVAYQAHATRNTFVILSITGGAASSGEIKIGGVTVGKIKLTMPGNLESGTIETMVSFICPPLVKWQVSKDATPFLFLGSSYLTL
jgi:hypothetical protein